MFCCFDVCFIRPPQTFLVQVKIPTVRPVFPDYLSVSYDYEIRKYCRFSYSGIWQLVNLFVGTKNFSYHICYENTDGKQHNTLKSRDRPRTEKTEQYVSKEECIK